METETQQLGARLTDSLARSPGVRLWLLRPLFTLLAAGEPVGVDQLAAEAERTADDIHQALAAMPDIEYDAEGHIVGYGLTSNPTPHRYETGGRSLYAWCALDTLAFPAILGQPARVTSACRATGEPIRLIVTPDGIDSVEPAGAVVSVVTPDAPASVRAAFCNQIHFFASAGGRRAVARRAPGRPGPARGRRPRGRPPRGPAGPRRGRRD